MVSGTNIMPVSVETKKEMLSVSWVDGVRQVVEIRNHRLVLDQPLEDGGQDRGVTPVELFVASLAGCIGYFAVRFCRRHAIPTDGLRITAEWDYAEQPHRVGAITVHADLPAALDSGMRRRLQKVLEGCTVHQSLTHSPRIAVELR
jgi:uncharacterized OsmC-like protein